MPLVRRIPKRGFNNRWAKTVLIVNVGDLNAAFKSGDKVTPESLAAANLVNGTYDELKILGNGEVTKKLKISAHRFSQAATDKITAAGGEAIVLPGPAPVVKNKMRKKQAARVRHLRRSAWPAISPPATRQPKCPSITKDGLTPCGKKSKSSGRFPSCAPRSA